MKTKFYKIQYTTGNGWLNLDDTEYTEAEANEFINSCPTDSTMKFRKEFLYEREM